MKKHLTRLLSFLLALVLLIAPASALTVEQALELLERYYYYEIPAEAYEAKSVQELIRTLGDPYTSYMSPEAYQAFLNSLEGDSNVVGIGVSIQYTEDGILVLDTISGGSAREVGFQAGDLIVEVDGVSCVPADSSCGDLLTGVEGSTVSVTILRDGQTSSYVLTRRPIIIPNTEIELLDGGIGYITCTSFGADAGTEFAKLVEQNDSEVNLWILDLRDNGGGYVQAAIDMLCALLGPGRYLYYEDGDGSLTYVPGNRLALTAKPILVLTNGSSASASEIVSSSIRDTGRGITIGRRTYGKGVAQSNLNEVTYPQYSEYFDGDNLKVTSYRFYSAGFNTTDKIGVIPTLLVDTDNTAAVALALGGREDSSPLRIDLGGSTYYLDPGTDSAILSALFAALPPQAKVSCLDNGKFAKCTIAQAAAKLGVDYTSRWFHDVGDSKYADAINAMGTYDLLQGTGGGNFTPNSQLTRAQLCVMLARVLNVAYRGPSLFTDVDQDLWYGPSVNAMAYLGLVEGVGNGKFSPNANITQEQFFTIMGRAARFINEGMDYYGQWVENGGQLTPSQKAALAAYPDWARSSMAVLAWGLEESFEIGGDLLYAPMGTLSPKTPILREEAAAGMYAVLSGLGILPREAN